MKIFLDNIKELTESIEYKTQIIGRNQRLFMGVNRTRIMGMVLGFIITIILAGIPIFYYKVGF